jgi:carboxyl-terminal processing protease
MMSVLALSKPLSPILINFTTTTHNNSINWTKKTIITALSGALSFGLVFSSPWSIALESPIVQSPPSPSSEYCREDEQLIKAETGPEVATNEGIVEEAWEIVNDSFIDTGRHRWSPQTWQVIYITRTFSLHISEYRIRYRLTYIAFEILSAKKARYSQHFDSDEIKSS